MEFDFSCPLVWSLWNGELPYELQSWLVESCACGFDLGQSLGTIHGEQVAILEKS